jgi:hypothetical protein
MLLIWLFKITLYLQKLDRRSWIGDMTRIHGDIVGIYLPRTKSNVATIL